jgi:hypothetical protein
LGKPDEKLRHTAVVARHSRLKDGVASLAYDRTIQ